MKACCNESGQLYMHRVLCMHILTSLIGPEATHAQPRQNVTGRLYSQIRLRGDQSLQYSSMFLQLMVTFSSYVSNGLALFFMGGRAAPTYAGSGEVRSSSALSV